MAHYMLDTDTCISLRMRRQAVQDRFAALRSGAAVMSLITYGELRVGVEKSRSRDAALATLNAMVGIVPVEPIPLTVGAAYGEIRAFLEPRGRIIGPNDLWIAAHARAAGLTLVTNNEREFRRVPDLKVENWAAAA